MLRAATIVLTVVIVFAGVYAVLTIALPDIIEGVTFEAVTGESLDGLQAAGYARPYLIIARHEGLFALTTVIPTGFILYHGFRRKQRWAWWAILLTSCLGWGWGLVDSSLHGAVINAVPHAAGLVLILVGLFLPFREFFGRGAVG